MSSTQPNETLYIKNLNDKVNKEELRLQLYALFTTYGRVVDIVAIKNQKMRGQAFLVFSDLASATAALRACEGIVFYDKPMHIEYAKTRSYATLQREDPNFVPPTTVHAQHTSGLNGRLANGSAEKRPREDRMDEDAPGAKREKVDADEEEMEIEDDDDAARQNVNAGVIPTTVQHMSARLLCTNLPQEVTVDVLSVLFQQYQGFLSAQVVPSPTPNAQGQTVKTAQVFFDSPDLASVAKEALDGFTLKRGWAMSVAYF